VSECVCACVCVSVYKRVCVLEVRSGFTHISINVSVPDLACACVHVCVCYDAL